MATRRTAKKRSAAADEFKYITMGFRCYRKHADLIERAAALVPVSNSNYMRRIVINQAAADLGETPPDFSELGGSASLISDAAKKRGLTVAEFTKQAARAAAAAELSTPPDPPPWPAGRLPPRGGR